MAGSATKLEKSVVLESRQLLLHNPRSGVLFSGERGERKKKTGHITDSYR